MPPPISAVSITADVPIIPQNASNNKGGASRNCGFGKLERETGCGDTPIGSCSKSENAAKHGKIKRGPEKLNRETGCGDTPLVYVLQIRYGMERGKKFAAQKN